MTVMGLPDTVDNAIDHLLNLEEEYVRAPTDSRATWMSLFVSDVFSSALRCSI